MATIISIVRKQIRDERLYNLAVEGDESFIANGVVVHNCKSRLVPNLKGVSNPEPTSGKVDLTQKELKSMTLAGYDK
jgi:hypothetical protein